jgi:hypothetical protein
VACPVACPDANRISFIKRKIPNPINPASMIPGISYCMANFPKTAQKDEEKSHGRARSERWEPAGGARTPGGEPLWHAPKDLSIFVISRTLPEHVKESGSRELPLAIFHQNASLFILYATGTKQSAGLFPGGRPTRASDRIGREIFSSFFPAPPTPPWP